MTKWPINPYEESEYEYGLFNAISNKFLEAEKSGRMSKEEIEKIISCWICIPFENNQMMEIAEAIVDALYGDTQPDERKERHET